MATQTGLLSEIAQKIKILNTTLCCKTFDVGTIDLGDVTLDLTSTNAILNLIKTDLENAQLACGNPGAKPFATTICNPTTISNPIVTAINAIPVPTDYSTLLTDIRTNTSNINLNTDTLESLISTNTTALNSFKTANHTDVLATKTSVDGVNTTLTSVLAKLNEACSTDGGTPINVQVCNPGGGGGADFTATNAILTNILTKDTSIDTKLTTTNSDLAVIQTQVTAINANTDTLESLGTTSNTNTAATKTSVDSVNTNITSLKTQLTQVNTNHVVVDNFPSTTTYNINEQFVLTGTTVTKTLVAGTYNSISITVIKGSATIDYSTISFVAPEGYTNNMQATTTLTNAVTVTLTVGSPSIDIVIITTLR